MLCLQRCFQLDTTALELLLAASAQPAARLSALALSHLLLEHWPGRALPRSQPASTATAHLTTAPHSDQPLHSVETEGTSAQQTTGDRASLQISFLPKGRTSGLKILALHNCIKVSSVALQTVSNACPELQMLLLGGCSFSISQGRPEPRLGANGSFAQPGHHRPSHWLQSLDIPVDGALAGGLVEAALCLQHLQVLELSHAPPGIAPALAADLALQKRTVQVVDLCATEGVQVCHLR